MFFPENNNIEQDLIDSILSVIYFHNIDIVLKNKIYLSSEDKGEKYFNYLLTASQDNQIKSFLSILEECKLKKEFMDIFIKGEINNDNINNIINRNQIDESLKSDLIGLFNNIQKKIIKIKEMNEKNIEIGGFNNSSSVKGNIFQLLLARLLFNNKDIIYYNTKGGGIGGNLYPDILFKNGLNLFVCDTKCYHDDNNIVPHKEFFYNIILSNNNKKCNVYGLIFTYDKENNANDFIIQKCFKLERHYFYLITINIKN